MRSKIPAWCAVAVLALPGAAAANDFVGSSRADWFRYVGPNGVEVRSQITAESSGWRLWDNFGGLGQQWIWADASSDWVYGWDGAAVQTIANLSGAVGTTSRANFGPLNNGNVRVAGRALSLTTPAGAFTDVTQLALTPSAADAGVTGIWFARGVGIVQFEQTSIAGPRRFQLGSALVGGRNYPAATTPTTPTTPVNNVTRAPSEHAGQELILWGCNDTYLVVDNYRDAFTGLNGSGVKSQVIVDSNATASELRYEMTQRNVPMTDVTVLVARVDSIWMRDYGPIVLRNPATGARSVADLEYYPGRPNDDTLPEAYAGYRGWPVTAVNISYEGGNFATDGKGQGFSSLGVRRFNPGMSLSAIQREFRKLGCDNVEFFEPLVDEGTTHCDMFFRVMADNKALVSRYPAGHRQKPITDACANRVAAMGYQVTRVDVATSHDEYATYANSTLANGIALIPQYGNAQKDQAALDAYRAVGFRPVGVDCRLIIQYGGATHCISMQVPR